MRRRPRWRRQQARRLPALAAVRRHVHAHDAAAAAAEREAANRHLRRSSSRVSRKHARVFKARQTCVAKSDEVLGRLASPETRDLRMWSKHNINLRARDMPVHCLGAVLGAVIHLARIRTPLLAAHAYLPVRCADGGARRGLADGAGHRGLLRQGGTGEELKNRSSRGYREFDKNAPPPSGAMAGSRGRQGRAHGESNPCLNVQAHTRVSTTSDGWPTPRPRPTIGSTPSCAAA